MLLEVDIERLPGDDLDQVAEDVGVEP